MNVNINLFLFKCQSEYDSQKKKIQSGANFAGFSSLGLLLACDLLRLNGKKRKERKGGEKAIFCKAS